MAMAPHAPALTARALLAGLLVGCVLGASNVAIGLKVGLTFPAAVTAAVLSYSAFKMLSPWLRHPFSIGENVIATTAGSSAGSMATAAGVISFVPALAMAGLPLSFPKLVAWTLATASLGILFAIPLRHQLIVVEQLRYPSGTAAAETIRAMHAETVGALGNAKVLLAAALGAACYKALVSIKPLGLTSLEHLGLEDIGLGTLTLGGVSLVALRIGLSTSPMLVGAGMLVGSRVGASLLLGSLVAWLGLAPPLSRHLWSDLAGPALFTPVLRFLVWPGAAMMLAAGLTSLGLNLGVWRRAFTSLRTAQQEAHLTPTLAISPRVWLLAMLLATSAVCALGAWLFAVQPWMSLVAIAVSFIMTLVAVRATAETDLNPVGPMAKVTQLVYGALAPGSMTTNLMTAGITAAGALQAGDLMHDLKTGFLLEVSPRRQVVAQFAGVLVGVFAVVGTYVLLAANYPIPGELFTGPAVQSWYAVAELLAHGYQALPAGASWAALVGACLGVLFTLLERQPVCRPFVPSPMAVSIAFLVPPAYAAALWLGSLIPGLMDRRRPQAGERLGPILGSGLIAGEGIMLVIVATLMLLGVPWL